MRPHSFCLRFLEFDCSPMRRQLAVALVFKVQATKQLLWLVVRFRTERGASRNKSEAQPCT